MTQEQNKRAPTQLQSERVIYIIVREHQGLWRVIDFMDMLEQDMNINAKQPDELLLTTIFDYIEHFSDRVHSQPTEIFLY